MRIIAIDPGVNTGIAIVNLFPLKLIELCTVPLSGIEFQLSLFDPTDIIIEKEPFTGTKQQTLLVGEIFRKCKIITEADIHYIYPSEWKVIAKAKEWKQSAGIDQHQKDAYNMLRFFVLKKFNQDIGELQKDNPK